VKQVLKRFMPEPVKRLLRPLIHRPPAFEREQKAFTYQLNVNDVGRQHGKAAIVTGGGGSIGSAICYRLAVEGAIVGIAGRNLEGLLAVVDQITSAGVPSDRLMALVMDITDRESVGKAIDSFVERHGRLDVFINTAGGSARGHIRPLETQDFKVIEDIINLNLLGTMRCCQHAIRYLKVNGGKIINFGSTIGSNGQKNYSEYSAAKSGVIGLTKSLALELGEYGITVNMITPGWVWRSAFDGKQHRRSDKTALGRYGYPEEVASLVSYLCTDEANYITGNDFKVDGGRTLGLMKE
jgi:3-oxoacyl-[acyl-carrier protein] reductase